MNPADSAPQVSFADVLTAAVQARGLSLERIRARLDAADAPVSIATLSYWQSGRSLPTRARSYHTLVELERILGLEVGDLTSHTHTSDGRTRRELFPWQTVIPVRELATQIIEDLGIEAQGRLARVTMFDHLTVRSDRTEDTQESQILWRAERNGLHRWPLVLLQDADAPGPLPAIESLFGCRLGEVIEVPERHLIVAEMIALRPMQRGDHFTSGHRISFPPTSLPSFRMTRAASDRLRSVSLCVTFDERTLPRSVRGGFSAAMDAEPEEHFTVELADHEAQLVRTEAAPGVHSLFWEWD